MSSSLLANEGDVGWAAKTNNAISAPQLNGFRLTLVAATPVTTIDQPSKGTIYLTPYTGDRISLFDGTNWQEYSSSEIWQGLGSAGPLGNNLSNNTNYDLFVFDNGGAVTFDLPFSAWTSNTARASSLVRQNGVWLKPSLSATVGSAGNVNAGTHSYLVSFVTNGVETAYWPLSGQINPVVASSISLANIPIGPTGTTARKIYRTVAGDTGSYMLQQTISDNTTTTGTDNTADASLGAAAPPFGTSRRYVGTIRTTTATTTEDSALNRFVFNADNRVCRRSVSHDSGSWNSSSTAYVFANAGNMNWKHSFVIGLDEQPVVVSATLAASTSQTGIGFYVGVSLDQSSSPSAASESFSGECGDLHSGYGITATGGYVGQPGIGYHWLNTIHALAFATLNATIGGNNEFSRMFSMSWR